MLSISLNDPPIICGPLTWKVVPWAFFWMEIIIGDRWTIVTIINTVKKSIKLYTGECIKYQNQSQPDSLKKDTNCCVVQQTESTTRSKVL